MTIGNGYFGKLPDRADFVVARFPEGFLKLWEPFLMKGLAQSRQDLSDSWLEAYMTMPVWRFWIEPDIASSNLDDPVAGALMPSVDKVGRKFPLTIASAVTVSEGQGRPSAGWYEEVEAALLGALQEESSLAEFQKAVSDLKEPQASGARETSFTPRPMEAMPETKGHVRSLFWCHAGRHLIGFSCEGLPDATEFQWLLLPEAFEADGEANQLAGENHGRYHREDHRT